MLCWPWGQARSTQESVHLWVADLFPDVTLLLFPLPVVNTVTGLPMTKQNSIFRRSTDYLQARRASSNITGKKPRGQAEAAAQPPAREPQRCSQTGCKGRGPGSDAQPHPASAGTVRAPAHLPVFRERQVQEWKVLSAEILIFNGQYKHFTN